LLAVFINKRKERNITVISRFKIAVLLLKKGGGRVRGDVEEERKRKRGGEKRRRKRRRRRRTDSYFPTNPVYLLAVNDELHFNYLLLPWKISESFVYRNH
jgi:hypothetical protein